MIPLWTRIDDLMPHQPVPRAVPHLWHWDELHPLAKKSGSFRGHPAQVRRHALAAACRGVPREDRKAVDRAILKNYLRHLLLEVSGSWEQISSQNSRSTKPGTGSAAVAPPRPTGPMSYPAPASTTTPWTPIANAVTPEQARSLLGHVALDRGVQSAWPPAHAPSQHQEHAATPGTAAAVDAGMPDRTSECRSPRCSPPGSGTLQSPALRHRE